MLRNKDLAAVEIDGYFNIVRAAEIRQCPLPIVARIAQARFVVTS